MLNAQVSRFVAEPGLSKGNIKPLLIYRLSGQQLEYCLKFAHRRKNNYDHSYFCLGCNELKKRNLYGATANSIRVSMDYKSFTTDPLALSHACLLKDNELYRYKYVDSQVQQLYRFVLILIQFNLIFGYLFLENNP